MKWCIVFYFSKKGERRWGEEDLSEKTPKIFVLLIKQGLLFYLKVHIFVFTENTFYNMYVTCFRRFVAVFYMVQKFLLNEILIYLHYLNFDKRVIIFTKDLWKLLFLSAFINIYCKYFCKYVSLDIVNFHTNFLFYMFINL